MSKECNGMIYMKDKKIEVLELQQTILSKDLDDLITSNKELKDAETKVTREVVTLENRFQMLELDGILEGRNSNDLDKRSDYLKGEHIRLSELVQQEEKILRGLEKKLEMYRGKLLERQTLGKRLSKETQLNERMIKSSGRVCVEKEKMKKELERNERELAILKGNLGAKNRFITVLEKKVGVKPRRETQLWQAKSQEKISTSIGDVIEDLAQIKAKRMKSFEKLVRTKNSVLLGARML